MHSENLKLTKPNVCTYLFMIRKKLYSWEYTIQCYWIGLWILAS